MYIVAKTRDSRLQIIGDDFEFTFTDKETQLIESCIKSLADLSSALQPTDRDNFIHSVFKEVGLKNFQNRLLHLNSHDAYQILMTLPDELMCHNDQVWGMPS